MRLAVVVMTSTSRVQVALRRRSLMREAMRRSLISRRRLKVWKRN